jgi:hypothetical protein
MTRGIILVLQTKTANIVSGFNLTCDAHVDLAYRVVESGIFSTMGRKHWAFAVGDGKTADAMLPMYRKVEKSDGVTRYFPRIPANAVRGSFSALLVALEAIADSNQVPAVSTAVASSSATADAQEDVITDPAGMLGFDDSTQAGRPEVLTLADGSQIEVIEWESVEPSVVMQALAASEGSDDIARESHEIGGAGDGAA